MTNRGIPLLDAARTDVVAFGPSLHDPDGYYLIRAYDSPEHRRVSQEAFHASAEWRQGPREEILALIETSTNAVM